MPSDIKGMKRENGSVPAAVDMACVTKALTVREDALIAAAQTNGDAMVAAFGARKAALVAAYAITDKGEMRTAVKAAWTSFDAAHKTADKTWLQTRNDAWKTFRTSAKSCGLADASGMETGTEELAPMGQ